MAVEIVGLGEILWDLLPTGRQLGGAPFNFAFHCHQLGHEAVMVSRVGDDDLGRAIRELMANHGLSDAALQTDAAHPTGTVDVQLDAAGQPTYTIHSEVAYDFLAWDHRLRMLCSQAQALCFGTLVQRTPLARETVRRAIRSVQGGIVVYDVNLRQQFYDRDTVHESLRLSRWVKLNDDELTVLRGLLGLEGEGESALLADLRRRYDLDLACMTRGSRGCLLRTAEEEIAVPGLPVDVVDTVGAGDAFTAGLLVSVLEGQTIPDAAVFANRLAARVAGSAGGTPRIERASI